jgi:hypothetical protein
LKKGISPFLKNQKPIRSFGFFIIFYYYCRSSFLLL